MTKDEYYSNIARKAWADNMGKKPSEGWAAVAAAILAAPPFFDEELELAKRFHTVFNIALKNSGVVFDEVVWREVAAEAQKLGAKMQSFQSDKSLLTETGDGSAQTLPSNPDHQANNFLRSEDT